MIGFRGLIIAMRLVMDERALRHLVIIQIAITARIAEVESAQIIPKGERRRLAIVNRLRLPGKPEPRRLNILSRNGLINNIHNAANGAIGKQK